MPLLLAAFVSPHFCLTGEASLRRQIVGDSRTATLLGHPRHHDNDIAAHSHCGDLQEPNH